MISLRRAVQRTVAAVASLLFIVACGNEPAKSPVAPQMAKGGPAAGTPAVTATDPSFGAQGQQFLTVRVLGSGFNASAKATWERGGVADTMITVHGTTFVSSSELRATISIAPNADTTLYDVAVTQDTDNGRKKGVGIELFQVADLVSLSGAVTANKQPVAVEQDDTLQLRMRVGAPAKLVFVSQHNFANTIAADTTNCVAGNSEISKAYMLALLNSAQVQLNNFGLAVYRPALGAKNYRHTLLLVYGNPIVRVRIGPAEEFPAIVTNPIDSYPRVDQTGPNTYRFSGGMVKINTFLQTKGKGSSSTTMFCPNLDVVDVTYPEDP
jgi:hypothetical protein